MEHDLLRAIADAPDDDGPRLVYADWLMERNDPRGELVQLQCKLAKLDDDADDAQTRRMKVRATKLLKAHGDDWRAPVLSLLPRATIEFARGLVEIVRCDAPDLHAAPRLLEVAPTVRNLQVSQCAQEPRFLDHPAIAKLRSLSMMNLDEYVVRAFAATKSVAGVVDLGMSLHDVERLFTVVVDSPHLHVRELRLTGREAPVGLLHMRWPLESFELQLQGASGVTAMEALARSPSIATIRRLTMRGMMLGPEGIAPLLAAPRPALEELDVAENQLGIEGLAALLDEARFPKLRILNVRGNRLGPEGAEVVARAAGSRRLRKLNIGGAKIGKQGALALAASPNLAGLEWLILSETKLDEATVNALLASRHLAKTKLWLQGRVVTKRDN